MTDIWKRFDLRLFALKLHDPALQMHAEISVAHRKIQSENSRSGRGPHSLYLEIIDCDMAILRKYLETVDRLCRDVWQTQGNRLTSEFVRAIPNELVMGLIGTRVDAIKVHIEQLAWQRNYSATGLGPLFGHLARTTSQLKAAVVNRYEVEAREIEYKNVPTSESISGGGSSKPVWEFAEGAVEQERSNEAQKTRWVTKAPSPPSILRGGSSYMPSRPKPMQIPRDHPLYYPNGLKPSTDAILAEAVRKFPVQRHALELCKYVISELTPCFIAEVQRMTLRADIALSRLGDLLHSLFAYNCDNENERFRLDQEARKSDEWLSLAKQIAGVAQDQLDSDRRLSKASSGPGRNIDKLRKECGWSFEGLSKETGIDKKLILSHINKGARPTPRILREYAQAFSKKLERKITAPDLEK